MRIRTKIFNPRIIPRIISSLPTDTYELSRSTVLTPQNWNLPIVELGLFPPFVTSNFANIFGKTGVFISWQKLTKLSGKGTFRYSKSPTSARNPTKSIALVEVPPEMIGTILEATV